MSDSFDITPYVESGGTFQIRFAEADNQDFQDMGVDNVSITASDASAVPEPATMTMLGIGVAGLTCDGWRKRRRPVIA